MENDSNIDPRFATIMIACFAIVVSCFLFVMAFLEIYGMFAWELRRYLGEDQQTVAKSIFVVFGILVGLGLVSVSGIFKAAATAKSPERTNKNPFADIIEEQTGLPFVPDV